MRLISILRTMVKKIAIIFLFALSVNCEQKQKNVKTKGDVNLISENKIISEDIKKYNEIYGQFYDRWDRKITRVSYGLNEKKEIVSLTVSGNIQLDSLTLFKNLESLWIKRNDSLSHANFDFEYLTKLKRLLIINCNLSQKVIIKNHRNLKSITIHFDEWQKKNKIEDIIFSNPTTTIEDLSIEAKLGKIPPSIKKMDGLKDLWLNNNQINYVNFDNLPKNLKIIRLGNNPIDKEKLKIEQKKRNIKVYLD